MKTYPSISREITKGISIYAFGKLDGSNIRAEWSKKQGFYKFGSRKRLVGTDQLWLPEAEQIIHEKFEKDLANIFKKNRWERALVFFEFLGENSFAGNHENESHELYIIDVNLYKEGILPPKEFLKHFDNLQIAPILYHGPCNGDFVESVLNSTLKGMPVEGVVCKAKNSKKTPEPLMFKIKSNTWRQRLKNFCGDDEKKYQQLL